MLVFYIFLSILLLSIILYLSKGNSTKTIFIVICSLLIVQFVLKPKLCIDAAVLGSKLFFYKVFPSLFPFLVISNIILLCNGIVLYSKLFGILLCRPLKLPLNCSFVIIISILCGYPMGAKYACDMLDNGLISTKTCQRLLNIATNASPLFIIGSVGTSMLKDTNLGYIILLSNLLSCFVMALLMPSPKIHNFEKGISSDFEASNIGDMMKSSIENAMKTCISIGGFVILFCVFNSIIKSNIIFNIALNQIHNWLGIPIYLLEGTALGLIEMTNGCYLIASSTATTALKISIISFLVSFSGLSIISQVYSFTYKFKLSIIKYSIKKIIQGVISTIICLILYKVIYRNLSVATFHTKTLAFNSLYLYILLVLLAFPLILKALRNLFKAA